MNSTTFGYDKAEDRLWMSFDDGTPRLWFTRRMASHFLGPMLNPFESTAPGNQGGAVAAVRVALEHELAMNELMPGERALPLKMGVDTSGESPSADHLLCTGLTASFDTGQCRMHFHTVDGEWDLQMSRVAMHRWLRGLHMVVQHADWDLPAPAWLSRSCLPDAVRSLLLGAPPSPPVAGTDG
jgi:hypothetical protein